MIDAFAFHLSQLIQIKIRSLIFTGLFFFSMSSGLLFLYPIKDLQLVILSIYALIVFVTILVFMHHLLILRYFVQIKRLALTDRTKTLELFETRLEEAKELRSHLVLKNLAHHFIEAYWAYQTVTD